MKVLVYTTLFPNHLQPNNAIFIKQRMFHFAKIKDCEIKVIAPIPYFPPIPVSQKWYQYSQVKKIEIMDRVEVLHPRYLLIPKISMAFHGFSLFLSSLRLAREVYRTFPFDLIDGHYIYPDGFAATLLAKMMKKPVVLSARGSDINESVNFKLIKPMIRYALGHADHVISVCDALKQEMIKMGIKDSKITTIPNGVDGRQFYPVETEIAREKLSISVNRQVILSVGSLIPRKGFHIVLEALSILIRRDPNINLYIIGEGPERPSLERQIRELGLSKFVSLVGELPNSQLKVWYSAADIFCLASSREGWANVIMESMACGTPVVATRVWGAPEILTSPDLGILVDRNPESVYTGLLKALETSWDRGKIRARVENRDWFKVAEEVKTLFLKILGNHLENNHSGQLGCH